MAGNITLTASLESILGGSALSGYMDVTLCGFGPQLPVVAGVGVLADGGVPQLEGPASSFSFVLYGNDVITPAGTFYAVTIYDEDRQPIQTNNYIFTGTETIDLSNAVPVINPPYNSPSNYLIFDPATGAVVINNNGWNGPITIDLTLTGNVTLSFVGFLRGQLVEIIIQQGGAGGYTVTWPSNVKNPAAVNPALNSVSTQNMVVRADGNLYPALGWS